jgi:nucleotide-binding universal stress UspA family protein
VTTTPGLRSGPPAVVVGFDGSPLSERAVLWAAREAHACHGTLSIIAAWEPTSESSWEGPRRRRRRRGAQVRAAVGLRLSQIEGQPAIPVRTVVLPESPSAALIDESAVGDLLVLGTHSQFGPLASLLGSTSKSVALNAHCPVVLVNGFTPPTPQRRCVVVRDARDDVEDSSARAWAAAQAGRAGLTLHVLTHWHAGIPSPWELRSEPRRAAGAEAARSHQQAMAHTRQIAADGVRVTGEVVEGRAADVLAAYTQSDDLVVVARGTIRRLEPVIAHARGPVVVVPPLSIRVASRAAADIVAQRGLHVMEWSRA